MVDYCDWCLTPLAFFFFFFLAYLQVDKKSVIFDVKDKYRKRGGDEVR